MSAAEKSIGAGVEVADSRLGSAGFLRRNAKKIFPDHWSFLLGEIALYCFVVEILTGIFLAFFFEPSLAEVTYHGSYPKLQGEEISAAYASALNITFDIRGGLLMRQIHHWAALVFVAAILLHLLRIFFTGAFRRPRELNWMIGLIMLILTMAEAFIGYGLPDDLLSGIGLRITQGIILSIPVLGTFVSFLIFGGEFPGTDFVGRFYIAHVLLFPGLLLALVTAHMMILWHQKHTQFPGKGKTERNVVGQPFYPLFMAKTGAFFMFTFGTLALLGTFFQINPIWLYGPYSPANVTAGAQADFYMGVLEGAVRLMPGGVEMVIFGHTLAWNIIIPALVVPGILITFFLFYPFIEQWATGDRRHHHLLDRPRNVPTRTAIGTASMTVYAAIWLAGGNDIIAFTFDISLQATTWMLRGLFLIGPVLVFVITRRICLGLQRRDKEILEHGRETGMVYRGPTGEIEEAHEHVTEEEHAVLASKPATPRIEASGWAESDVPPPRAVVGRLQARLNHLYTDDDVDVVPENGHYAGWDEQTEREQIAQRRQISQGDTE